METKVCKECGRELPIEQFVMCKYGHRIDVCKDCKAKRKLAKKAAQKNASEKALADARMMKLQEFEATELFQEIERRGFKGTLKIVQERTVEIGNLNPYSHAKYD